MVMEIIREGLIITPTGSLEPSQGSYDVPVKLINDETYPYYTINMYVGYYVNGVIKKRKCETDSEGHYLIPGIAFLRSGIISISFLLETADKSQGLMTNALSYEIKHAPNVVVEVPADPTWQELVKEWIQELAGAVNVDNTLTKSGMAADAKATGDAISKLSDEIDDLKENGLNQNIDEAVANYLSENPISGGLTSTAKNLLITILRNSLYSNNQSENITALETALGQSSSDTTVYYSITNTLTNVTNNNSNTQVLENTSYIASLSANNGYTLESITVTMGGIDITSSVYADGVITVSGVTGDIIITANAIISTTSNDELITDGLLAYVDGRTCTYNNSNSNGATTIIPNQGSGQFFAWAKDGVEVQDEYGLHFANSRDHMYDKDGGTNESDLGTQFTVVHLTKGNVGFGGEFKNVPPYWKFKPYYITTSGSRMDITDSSSYNGDSKDDYNFMVYRVDGTKLTQIMDTSRVDRDGSTIDGFASWNAKVGLGMQIQNADGMYVTAFAVYNRALSDVEIEEMRAFFKTLEVSA